jgi:hypothetical protein
MNQPQYKEDHRGNLVPVSKIKPIDLLRDNVVERIVDRAKQVSVVLQQFKAEAMSDITAFTEQSASEYSVKYGGEKGNIQLLSFDGKFKVIKSINEYIVFDERLQIAKKLIDECIASWTSGASDNIQALINHAFEVNKQGKINTERILGLRRLNITDDAWVRAMGAIGDSVQITGSKEYVRVYVRQDDGSYEQIPLDLASV